MTIKFVTALNISRFELVLLYWRWTLSPNAVGGTEVTVGGTAGAKVTAGGTEGSGVGTGCSGVGSGGTEGTVVGNEVTEAGTAVGTESTAVGTEGTAVGTEGTAVGIEGIVVGTEGTEGTAVGTEGTAVGSEGTAAGTESTAVGTEGTAVGTEGTSVGIEGTAGGTAWLEPIVCSSMTAAFKEPWCPIGNTARFLSENFFHPSLNPAQMWITMVRIKRYKYNLKSTITNKPVIQGRNNHNLIMITPKYDAPTMIKQL
jgi:hypothetical protein